VLGLLLIGARPLDAVKTVTAFTVAHSITLAVATFDRHGARATERGDRAVDPVLGPEMCGVGGETQLHDPPSVGRGNSRSGVHGSVLPAAGGSWPAKARSRWRCCFSTSASNSASWAFVL